MSILRMPSVKTETGNKSHASIYSAIHDGLFTMPVQIGQRSVGWPSEEVAAINAARIAGRSDDEIRVLVTQLHDARSEKFGEPFKPTWLDRSAQVKKQAEKRRKRTAKTGATAYESAVTDHASNGTYTPVRQDGNPTVLLGDAK